MGTNYYWTDEINACPKCGHHDGETLHIGKSSMGWVFAMRVYPEFHINNFTDWKTAFRARNSTIRNEYGEKITPLEMISIIEDRQSQSGRWPSVDWMVQNQAVPGPNGLARAERAKHGEGTWDYHEGEFC